MLSKIEGFNRQKMLSIVLEMNFKIKLLLVIIEI